MKKEVTLAKCWLRETWVKNGLSSVAPGGGPSMVGVGKAPRVEPGEITVLNAARGNGLVRRPGLIRDILISRARV